MFADAEWFGSKVWPLMIRAYFDDSGKESTPSGAFVCMAGYLADSSYWELFASEWRQRLLEHGISGIHMKDLIPLQGEYKTLGWDTTKRDAAIGDFIQVIKATRLIGFGVGVDAQAWRDLRKVYPKLDDVQTFCFARVMRMVIERVSKAAARDFVAVHFDPDPEFGAARLRLFDEIWRRDPAARNYLASLTFADKVIYTPLQAADLLAWETRKELIQKAGGFESTPRYKELFTALAGIQLQYHSELWDRSEIEARALNILGIAPGQTRPATGSERKLCPECNHEFQGNGWDGIDAHWRSRHSQIMSYEQAWLLIQSGQYKRK